MRTGASPRPTVSRRSSTRRRTWSGVSQLRWKRMKPTGSASRKKARSSAARIAPAQPKIAARGAAGSGADEEAGDMTMLQLFADMLGLAAVADRAGLDAVPDAALAEIGARPFGAEAAEEILLRRADLAPGAARRGLAADRRELQAIAARARAGLRRLLRGGRFRRGRCDRLRFRRCRDVLRRR